MYSFSCFTSQQLHVDTNVSLAVRLNITAMFYSISLLARILFVATVPNALKICVLSNGFCGLTVTLSRGFSQDKAERMTD